MDKGNLMRIMASGTLGRIRTTLNWQRSIMVWRNSMHGCPEISSGYSWFFSTSSNPRDRRRQTPTGSTSETLQHPARWRRLTRAASAKLPTPNTQIHPTRSSDLSVDQTKVGVINQQALETTLLAWMWHINSFPGNHVRQLGKLLKQGSTAVFQEIWEVWGYTGNVDFPPRVVGKG